MPLRWLFRLFSRFPILLWLPVYRISRLPALFWLHFLLILCNQWPKAPSDEDLSALNTSGMSNIFFLSPITTTCENIGKIVLITFSISTGATFYPPAVISSSLILPVMAKLPFFYTMPTSPECTNPFLSTVFLVYYSFLKYPIKQLRPLKHIYPLPSASGLSIASSSPGRLLPASL